jgi:hypothetical protein
MKEFALPPTEGIVVRRSRRCASHRDHGQLKARLSGAPRPLHIGSGLLAGCRRRAPSRPPADGTTELDAVVVREGKNLKGRALGALLGIVGKRVLGRELEKTAKAIEARNDGPRAAGLT